MMTMARCQHQAAVDQDDLIKAFVKMLQKLESALASQPHSFFSEHADQDSTRKGARSDPLDKNALFGSTLHVTLREMADMIEEMRNLPSDHEYHHK